MKTVLIILYIITFIINFIISLDMLYTSIKFDFHDKDTIEKIQFVICLISLNFIPFINPIILFLCKSELNGKVKKYKNIIKNLKNKE